MYEGTSVEPLGYSVTGSFTVIRYAKDAFKNIGGKKPSGVADNDAGNGVGNWGGVWGGTAGDFLAQNGVGNDGRANEALDPSKFANGTTFDIQIFQNTENGEIGVANVRNARITSANFSVNKRGAATEQFYFTALYVDGDAFRADFSGLAQHFT